MKFIRWIKKLFKDRALLKFVLKNPKILKVLQLVGKALKDGHISPQEIAGVISAVLAIFNVPISINIVDLKVKMEFTWPRRLL